MKKSYIIGAIIVVLAMIMAMHSFKRTMTPYVTVREAKAGKRPVQVAGIPVKGTARYDATRNNNLVFTLREDGGDQMVVEYHGDRSVMLDDVTKVVAEGKYEPKTDTFEAKKLLVKCPTKYEGRVKGE
jgi:cytochrome c-type biogenesis protein CcmE